MAGEKKNLEDIAELVLYGSQICDLLNMKSKDFVKEVINDCSELWPGVNHEVLPGQKCH